MSAHPDIDLVIEGYGHGGVGVARHDGMVHFVPGAIPGDRVRVAITKRAKRWARAEITELVAASPHRRQPPCPHAGDCGGCDLQHADEEAQRGWKVGALVDQLTRLGGLDAPPVEPIVTPSPPFGYRNRMDFSVHDGAPALHRRASHDLVALDVCLLLVPPLAELFADLGDLTGLTSVTMRAGAATGDLLLVVTGEVPDRLRRLGVPLVRLDEPEVIGRDHLHEVVAGTRLRITRRGFFQNSTLGAEALVTLVGEAVAGRRGTLVDLYAGGGLFACTVGGGFERTVAVESGSSAGADLLHNAATAGVEALVGRVEDLDLAVGGEVTVVVDPPRTGLGTAGVATVRSLAPGRIVYVSCDPASLGRDVGLLVAEGFGVSRVTPVDLFPQTHHLETVVVLDR